MVTESLSGQPQRLVDFDAVLPQSIEIRRGGRTLALRDDVPMREVVRVFRLVEHQRAQPRDDATSSDALEAWYDELERMTRERCLAFVRHSYPEMTAEELDNWLGFDQQMQLVMLFFQIRSQRFSPPASAPTSDSAATTSPAATPTGRKAGRAAAADSSVMASRPTKRPGRVAGTTRPRR